MIEILCNTDMVKRVLIRLSVDQQQYVLKIVDNNLLSNEDKHTIINLPSKLPIIVKPYSKQHKGGLLNDVNFT